MRVRGLAFVGLVVGAFMASSLNTVSATAAASSSLDRLFSSDGPESLHEAKNQGTIDEPKAWPEANAWLHAQLSDAERDFLSLAVTGTLVANPDLTGGLTQSQLTSTAGSVTVSVRLAQATANTAFLTQFRTDVVSAISLSSSSSVSAATASPTVVGSSVFTIVTFTFSANGANSAGSQYQQLASQFTSASSALRLSSSFNNADLSYFPTATFVASTTPVPTSATAPTAAPTSTAAVASTAAATSSSTGGYCDTRPTACLNGGTCINGLTPTSYECSCSSGFIGNMCQFTLIGNRRSASSAGSVARGKSVTRPNAAVKPKSA